MNRFCMKNEQKLALKELPPTIVADVLHAVNSVGVPNISVNVAQQRIKPTAEFCFMFIMNMLELTKDEDITKQDLAVLIQYSAKMQYGNQINISQQDIADELGIDKSKVSKSVKKLVERGVFYKEKRSLYMNWKYLAKGNLSDFIKADKENHAILDSMKSRKPKNSGFTDLHFLFFLNAVVFIISRLLFCCTS